jgi:hypothetical protein
MKKDKRFRPPLFLVARDGQFVCKDWEERAQRMRREQWERLYAERQARRIARFLCNEERIRK